MTANVKLGKAEAQVLQGVAGNLFSDTRKILTKANGVMQSIYDCVREACKGREAAHVKYLTSKYKQLIKDDPSLSTCEGTVGQVTAVVNRLTAEGMELPEDYGQARRLAYPPKTREPRQPVADEEAGTTMEQTLSVVPTQREPVIGSKLAELFGYLRELDQAGYDWSYAEQAIRSTYAEYSIEKSMQADSLDALDLEAEAA